MGKKSTKTTAQTVYGNTTTSNPYSTATTNNQGTTANFVKGSAFDTIYNVVNKNINSLLDEYLNPTLDSTVNKAFQKKYVTFFSSNRFVQKFIKPSNRLIEQLYKYIAFGISRQLCKSYK